MSTTKKFNREVEAIERFYQPKSFLDIPGCKFSATALEIEQGLSFEHWQGVGRMLRKIEGAVLWWIGDWFAYGEREHGEMSSQEAKLSTGYEPNSLWNLSSISKRVESSRRREDLSWSHHAEVASLEPALQTKWLDRAKKDGLSAKSLRVAVQAEKRNGRIAANLAALPPEEYRLIHGELSQAIKEIKNQSVDVIITDPPYPEEYIPLYAILAEEGRRVLKPNGSMLVMVGQSYLPEILALMTPHIRYHWTVDYRTPGAHTQIWQRKVMCGWKPVLWFVNGNYNGDWKYDVARSERPDKQHHEWGQSESGMVDLVENFSYPGDTVLDPFCGAGTTGVVAVRMKRYFIGIDVDEQAIETSTQRLYDATEAGRT